MITCVIMRVARLVVPVLLFAACTKAPPKNAPEAAPSVAPVQVQLQAAAPAPQTPLAPADCTAQTQLVPGIPGSPGHLIPSSVNPNGQSELSALMRSMQTDLKAARDRVARGEKVGPFAPRFKKIRCAWPTNPSERDAQFDGFAQSYLTAVAALDAAAPSQVGPAYDGVLSACRSCHEQSCSGAIVAIEALRLGGMSAPPPAASPTTSPSK